ncbi:MAG: 3-isopropylmalate dehydratase small subunit [Candidatus Dormibacteraeota bacterium]|nr:3-isopropylmalate dehydratase small subunit [Candidatus Dormibacteraeota bacterium]
MARIFKLGDGVSTDAIMPGRYNVTTDFDSLRRGCLIEARPDFVETVQPGDVIVAGRNFGCGSSREHAPLAIKQNGVACVIAASFARIFYRNAVNIGLPVIRCHEVHDAVADGDECSVDVRSGSITVNGRVFQGEPPSGVALQIIEAGSLLELINTQGWEAIARVS